MLRRLLLVVPLALPVVLVSAPAAHADHTHVRVLGSGACVLLAPDGGERHVELPRTDQPLPTRRHPMHTNVHLGKPGQWGAIHVAYAADGALTPAALQMCGGEFVNRR